MSNPVLYVDMDDVMADFVGAACLAHGMTREKMETRRKPGCWDIKKALGANTLKEFWEPINATGSEFWYNLEPLPWFGELVELLVWLQIEWYILSTPGNCPSSYVGKVMWIEKYFGEEFVNYILTPHKHLLAHNAFLVDDRPDNINKFIEHGGRGMIFPTLGGPPLVHDYVHDPVGHIAKFLPKLLGR